METQINALPYSKKNTMKNRFLITCLFLFIFSYGYSQEWLTPDQPIVMGSPNAMSLGTFGEFPAALSTGVPSVMVPVYEINYRNIKIPITLSYNINLAKPDIHPGWVGLGFNLDAGGSITRIVNDKPDDCTLFDFDLDDRTSGYNQIGYYYNYNYANNVNWSSSTSIQNATNDLAGHLTSGNFQIPRVLKDYQPDEFQFSFLGYSGCFYLDETKNWKVRCDQRIKVTFNAADMVTNLGAGTSFGKFTLTDTKGVKYVFGGSASSVEISTSLLSVDISPWVAKTWHLTQIILPNGETINFTYVRGSKVMTALNRANDPNNFSGFRDEGSIVMPSYLMSIATPKEQLNFNISQSTELGYDSTQFQQDATIFANQNLLPWTQMSQSAPFPTNVFDRYIRGGGSQYIGTSSIDGVPYTSINHRKLDSITVINGFTNATIAKFRFNYNNDITKRLKLVSFVKADGGATNQTETYGFTYNPLSLPPYLTTAEDFLGYYNGKTTSNDKLPDSTYMQAEILTKVLYPTGGYTVYKYEPHTYSQNLQFIRSNPLTAAPTPNQMGAGLRIAEVDNYDLTGALINWRKLAYVTGYAPGATGLSSSGILGGYVSTPIDNTPNSKRDGSTNTSINLPTAQNNQGCQIGYSEVTEIFSDGSYRINDFSNFDNGEYMDEPPINQLFWHNQTNLPSNLKNYTSKAFERGKLLRQRTYSASKALLLDHTIQYAAINKSTEFVRNITTEFSMYSANNVYTMDFGGSAFKTYTYSYLPSQETFITYQAPTKAVAETKTYSYDPVTLNLITTVTQNSKNQTIETDNYYPADMVSMGQDISGVYSSMVNANMIGFPIQDIKKNNSVQETLSSYNYINPSPGIFVPGSRSIQVQNNTIQQIEQYLNYDSLGNLLCESRPNGESISYQWGYSNQLPVAKVENAINTLGSAVQPNGNANAYITLPVGSTQAYSQQINVGSGTPTIVTLSFTGIPNSNTVASANVSITGTGYSNSFTLCNSPSGSCSNPISQTINGIPQGTYTISATYNYATNLTASAQVVFSYPSTVTVATGIKEFYYNGFEDDPNAVAGTAASPAHTGTKYGTTNSVAWSAPSNGRTYVISYWYRLGTVWTYSGEKPYTGSAGSPYVFSGGGNAFDEIRIFPSDASMTTYTYDPLAGLTSITDAKGETTYYEYDSFLRLMNIKDKDGNIVKRTDYHYQGQ